MTNIFQLATFAITVLFLSCNSRSSDAKHSVSEGDTTISTNNTLIDTPRSFVKNYGANDNNRLFAFIGQRISIEYLPRTETSRDTGVEAKYLILEKVFGDFSEDTIEFVAYDHYGTPAFSLYENVLLFVSADRGTYFQQKYMYNDVYRTKDGRWAGAVPDDYYHEFNKHTKIKPTKIEFSEKVVYPTTRYDEEGRKITVYYSEPYYKTVGDSAFVIYGNYVEDLFKLKRDGYLTAREIFRNGKLIQ